MAEGGPRQNKVFKAMNRPLTVLGAERRLFFVALITGGSIFSLLHSLLAGDTVRSCATSSRVIHPVKPEAHTEEERVVGGILIGVTLFLLLAIHMLNS